MIGASIEATGDVCVQIGNAQSEAVLQPIIHHEPPLNVKLDRIGARVCLVDRVYPLIDALLRQTLNLVRYLVYKAPLLNHP